MLRTSHSRRPAGAPRLRAAALVASLLLAALAPAEPASAAISRSQELKSKAFQKLTRGIKALREGKPKEAIPLLEEVTSVALNSFRAFYYLGLAYKGDRQYTKAIEPLSFALELNPNHMQAHVDLGDCYLKRGDISEALAEYHRSRALQERYAPAWDGIARAAEARGDDDAAIFSFKKAIDLNPGFPDAALNLGDLYLRRQRLQEAVELFLKAIGIRPNFAAAYNRLGVAYARQKLGNEAIAALRRAADLEEGNPWHTYTIGLIEMEFGYFGPAMRDFDTTLRMDENYLEAYAAKARLLRRLGHFTVALDLLKEARIRPFDDVRVKQEIEDLHGEMTTQWILHQQITEKIRSGEATAEDRAALARLQSEFGDFALAAETLKGVLVPPPDPAGSGEGSSPEGSPAVRFRLGFYLLKAGSFEEAEAIFRALDEENPESPATLLNMALSLQAQGRTAAAEAALLRARDLDPGDPEILVALGNVRVIEGKLEAAEEAFRRALETAASFVSRPRVETILKALEKYAPEASS